MAAVADPAPPPPPTGNSATGTSTSWNPNRDSDDTATCMSSSMPYSLPTVDNSDSHMNMKPLAAMCDSSRCPARSLPTAPGMRSEKGGGGGGAVDAWGDPSLAADPPPLTWLLLLAPSRLGTPLAPAPAPVPLPAAPAPAVPSPVPAPPMALETGTPGLGLAPVTNSLLEEECGMPSLASKQRRWKQNASRIVATNDDTSAEAAWVTAASIRNWYCRRSHAQQQNIQTLGAGAHTSMRSRVAFTRELGKALHNKGARRI